MTLKKISDIMKTGQEVVGMKKLIPVVVVLVLIILVVAIGFGGQVINRYTYSQERADLKEYFKIEDDSLLPIIWQDTITEDRLRFEQNSCYMEAGMADRYFGVEFYYDSAQDALLYTTATEVIRTTLGSNEYTGKEGVVSEKSALTLPISEDGLIYINLDYLKMYANFSYEVIEQPKRVQIYTQWEERKVADLKEDTSVRYQGGIKSPILEDVVTGQVLVILEEMETWTKVKTNTGIIGYVEKKLLSDARMEALSQVNSLNLPEFEPTLKDYRISMGWHMIGGPAGNQTLTEMLANTKGMNTISPTWFSIQDNAGNFSSFADKNYVKTAHDNGIEVWALIDDFNPNIDLFTVLSNSESRANLINNLIATSLEYELDGINIDFEHVSEEASTHFIQFLRELSIPCREYDIVLSVDNYVPREHTSHYNRQQQGVYADYVVIMGYDEHWNGSSQAGSVSSIDFTEDGIVQTLKEVPAEKVINGIPFYTRIWTTEESGVSSEAVGMLLAESWVANKGLMPVWNEETCQNYAEYEANGKFYQVWLEDEASIEVKLNVMNRYQIAGVAMWKLGFEKPSVWEVINAYVEAAN
jgi:spore germination protein YaaH